MHYTANGNFVNDQVRENFKTIKNKKRIENFEDVSSEPNRSSEMNQSSEQNYTFSETVKMISSALAPSDSSRPMTIMTAPPNNESDGSAETTYEFGNKIYIVGKQGPRGEQGQVGPTGTQGGIGMKGDQGYPGPNGDKGDTGPAGAAGQPGVTGGKGDQGVQGPQGVAGPKGDQGPLGPSGPAFDTSMIQEQVCIFYNSLTSNLPDKTITPPNFCTKFVNLRDTNPSSLPQPPGGGQASETTYYSAPYQGTSSE